MPLTQEQLRQEAREMERRIDGQVEFMPNPLAKFMPKYQIYIFNVGPLKHEVPKGSLGTYRIEACEKGKDYSKPLTLPAIVSSSYMDAASDSMKTDDVDGKFIAQDIVNPFLGGDWSEGQNLEEKGVFWTLNAVPTEEELTKAREKLGGYFRKILGIATELETKGQLMSITPHMRLAATYFGEDRAWNRIYKKLAACPSCQEDMKPGTLKHSCGYVVDPANAYVAGVISIKDRDDLLKRRGLAIPAE